MLLITKKPPRTLYEWQSLLSGFHEFMHVGLDKTKQGVKGMSLFTLWVDSKNFILIFFMLLFKIQNLTNQTLNLNQIHRFKRDIR